MKKLAYLILSLSIILITLVYTIPKIQLSPENPATQEKQIQVTINQDTTSTTNILWKIKVLDALSTFPTGNWGITIPKNSQNITVTDNNQNLNFTIKNETMLLFRNPSKIYYNEEYFFNITYTTLNNPIIYEPYYFYQQRFTRFNTDDKFSITFNLPENAQTTSELTPSLEKGETKTIKIDFTIPEPLLSPPQTITINSRHYQATLPEIYSQQYQDILNKADQGVEQIEKLYGFPSPYKWQIEFINQDDPDFEEQTKAFYLGEGKIRIKITNLHDTEERIIYILLHETVHGFNSKFFSDETPNFWWEEGTAQYIPYEILSNLRYNTEDLKAQNLELIILCQNQDLSFISEWSPNQLLQKKQTIKCKNESINLIELGYAQSYNIVYTLADTYTKEIFKKFYSTAELLQINFSSDHNTLNNQMNYILTQTTNQDTTTLLNSLYLNVQSKQNLTNILTGMPIYEEKEIKITPALIITAIIILITLIIILLCKNRKK